MTTASGSDHGPLAPLFAQVREALDIYALEDSWEDVTRPRDDWPTFEYCGDDGKELPWEIARESLAALSSIERHVQDMAPVVDAARRVNETAGFLRAHVEAKKELRRALAALSAPAEEDA